MRMDEKRAKKDYPSVKVKKHKCEMEDLWAVHEFSASPCLWCRFCHIRI